MEYLISHVRQPLIDLSLVGERLFVGGDTEFELIGYNHRARGGLFEKSECSILIRHLPNEVQQKWVEFRDSVIRWVKETETQGERSENLQQQNVHHR